MGRPEPAVPLPVVLLVHEVKFPDWRLALDKRLPALAVPTVTASRIAKARVSDEKRFIQSLLIVRDSVGLPILLQM
jgi:hypothetical protein